MRILLHDYSGHPFQVQLSRALSKRGHEVLHLYSAAFQTPHGAVSSRAGDPDRFECRAIELGAPFAKYSYFRRRSQEIEYGRRLLRAVEMFAPEAVISANTPLDAQKQLVGFCRRHGIYFLFWLQDLYGVAIRKILGERYWLLGQVIGDHYWRLERALLRDSDDVVAISEDFVPALRGVMVDRARIHVIENWAPLEEMPLLSKRNAWSEGNGLADKLCMLYSGTLGMKHNPELLLAAAEAVRDRQDVAVVVVSEGLGADYLRRERAARGLSNMRILGFQAFDALPQVLASADILVAVLEADAGVYSVPSKVLSYHCAGRALLLAVPEENLSARIVSGHSTGLVVPPGDTAGFVAAATRLLDDAELRAECGERARNYAEQTFDIEAITDKFEWLLERGKHLRG